MGRRCTSMAVTSDLDLAKYSVPDVSNLHWYAVYTRVHQERRVAEKLKNQELRTFLPLYSKLHRGKKEAAIELPLFTGYVFVQFCAQERIRVLTTSGVCKIVGRGSNPEPLPDAEVDGLMQASTAKLMTRPHGQLQVGRKVRIKAGPFEGIEGVLTRHKGQFRAVISLSAIASAFA